MYGYAILSGLTLDVLWAHKRYGGITKPFACILAFGAFAGTYPMIEGQMFAAQAITPLPSRYIKMADWFNAQPPGGSILEMPVSPYAFDAYKWGYVGAGLLPNLIRRPIISRMFDFASRQTASLDNAMQYFKTNVGSDHVAALMSLYNVRYIVDDPTINPQYFSPTLFSEFLSHAPLGIRLVKTFGSLRVYELAREINPLVYSASQVYTSRHSWSLLSMLRVCTLHRAVCPHTAFVTNVPAKIMPVASVIESDSLHFVDREVKTYAIVPSKSRSSVSSRFHRLFGHHNFFKYNMLSSPVRLCAGVNGHGESSLVVHGISRSQIGFLSIVYGHANVNPIVYVREPNSASYFQAALPSTRLNRGFSRLLSLGASKSVDIFVSLGAGGTQNKCATLDQLSLLPIPSTLDVHLVSSSLHFDETSLGVASNPNVMSHVAQGSLIGISRKQSSLVSNGATADTARHWDFVDTLSSSRNQKNTATLSDTNEGMQQLEIRYGSADAHEWLGGLLPGAKYRISFKYRSARGVDPRFALLTEQGMELSSRSLSSSSGVHTLSVVVILPPNVTTLVPYIYITSGVKGEGAIDISPISTKLVNGPRYVSILGNSRVSVPRTIRVAKLGGTAYSVKVLAAPSKYLLVMNSSFSRGWRLMSTNKSIHIKHIRVNQSVNGWIISGVSGNQLLSLSYSGGYWARLGFGISLFAAICGLLLVVSWRLG